MPNEISHTGDVHKMEMPLSNEYQNTKAKVPGQVNRLDNISTDNYVRYNTSRKRHGLTSKNHSFAGLEDVYIEGCSKKFTRSYSNKGQCSQVTANNGCLITKLCDSFCDNLSLSENHRNPQSYKYSRDRNGMSSVEHGANVPGEFDENSNTGTEKVITERRKDRRKNGIIKRSACKRENIVLDLTDNNNAKAVPLDGQGVAAGTALQQEVVSLQSPTLSSSASNRSMVSMEEKPRLLARQQTFRMDSLEMIESLLGSPTALPNDAKPKRHRGSNPFPAVSKKISRKKRHSQPTNNKLEDYRLVVLGSGGVGKSSLVEQFLHGFFSCQYNPTVEESYRHLVQLPDGVFHTIEILDTAGLHQFPAMRRLSIISGDAFIVVFSLDNKDSFKEALGLVELIFEIKGAKCKPRVPVILVGNKSDLDDKKEVTEREALTACFEHGLYAYIQTSAKDNDNVQKLFSELMVHVFGVHERLQQAEAKRGLSFRTISRQLSERVRKLSQRRHHSDSGDYRVCVVNNKHEDTDEKTKDNGRGDGSGCSGGAGGKTTSSSCENRGCVLGEPACCIL